MNNKQLSSFIFYGIFNLCFVALIGVLMRYKIGFEFPYFNQKNLLHSHSHFAFSGWVSHILYTLMYHFLQKNGIKSHYIPRLIIANLVCAFGMMVSFIYQGYGGISITFSTLSILISYVFTYVFLKELKQVSDDNPSGNWFAASLFFNVLSSLGTFFLAYMMVSKNIDQNFYLGSVYFFLHFQYNGWFLFAMAGLFFGKLHEIPGFIYNPKIFYFFFISCIPAFFLSVLWANLPWYIFLLPVAAVILQLWGIKLFFEMVVSQFETIKTIGTKVVRLILGLSLTALSIKILLQTGSIFPEISKLAFGFRSIVIAYLHLVLLAFTTLFLLGYLLWNGFISHHKTAVLALIMFCVGVFANEFVLMIQGIASFGYILIPYLNETLFGISLFMFGSLVLLMFFFQKDRTL
jgi:hypothetical protein